MASDYKSVVSDSTYFTALSRVSGQSVKVLPGQLREEDEYAKILQAKDIWPVDPAVEQNWSGRGEHLELSPSDREFINQTLEPHQFLGRTHTATVESVRCKRILLARKTISCSRHFTKDAAIEEVAHLKKLQHAHIVRIMGTYVLGRKLSILLYPVANHNLETFLEAMNEGDSHENLENMRRSCKGFFTCLSSAMHYIHSKLTKHMDIKPKNILVRLENRRIAWGLLRTRYTVFIADFGIARSYQQLNATETDSPTSFTRKYAAPEVVLQDKRGLPADIFSLGCVFLEMIAVLNGMPGTGVNSLYYAEIMFRSPKHKTTTLTMDVLQTLLEESPSSDSSYCSNITTISRELSVLGSWRLIEFRVVVPRDGGLANLIQRMLSEDPEARPSARDLVFQFPSVQCCCDAGPVPLEALVSENSEPAS